MSKTSWQVKARYNNKTYGTITVRLPKAEVKEFKNLCREQGVSQASVISEFLKIFLKKNKKSVDILS